MSKRVAVQTALTETGTEVTASLAQHRVLSTAQVRAIHLPGRGERWTQRLLVRLEQAGLAGYVQAPRSHGRLWHATELGARLSQEAGLLDAEPRLIGAEQAAGPLQAHTLAVNDSAICFVEAARKRGDDFGPFAWHHEVAHPVSLGRGRRRRRLIADAVLTYLRIEEDGVAVEQRFLEIDRATLTVDRLAAELSRYAELQGLAGSDGEPVWRSRYPFFPPVHCVLTGGRRPALERRRATVLALLRSDARLFRTPRSGSRSACSTTWRATVPSRRSSAMLATRSARSIGSAAARHPRGRSDDRRSAAVPEGGSINPVEISGARS